MESKPLDITIIICPECGKKIHAFMDHEPSSCPKCEADLRNAEEISTGEVAVYLYHDGRVEGEVVYG